MSYGVVQFIVIFPFKNVLDHIGIHMYMLIQINELFQIDDVLIISILYTKNCSSEQGLVNAACINSVQWWRVELGR